MAIAENSPAVAGFTARFISLRAMILPFVMRITAVSAFPMQTVFERSI